MKSKHLAGKSCAGADDQEETTLKKTKIMSNIISQDYHILDEVQTDGEIPLTLYENRITGLRVVTADVVSPIVKGDLVFATEAFDDDGLPHTLEHLVFMGSESYPYKGVLDLLANRCFSQGTNACTDTDNTNYTISTAGSDGFLNLLPIYLDHLLFPTLTDAAYDTEVHHINAEGENAGIVYCEMQSRENSGDSLCSLELLRSMYPGKCGYKSQTGGILENLRQSTNNEKVRAYHEQYYHAKNLCIVVTGPCAAKDIFKAIKPIEDKIIQKKLHLKEFERPWQTPVEPLEASVEKCIQYPSDTDDDGLVYIGFRGPNTCNNYQDFIAISVILDYLDSTSISPIQRDFVESDEPYCSSVTHTLLENSTSCFYLIFESVGKQYLNLLASKFFELLHNIASGKEAFDMDRMGIILSRKRAKILSMAETSPHAIVIGAVVGHFLYGTGKLEERAQEIPVLEDFATFDSEFWLSMIDKYLTGPNARYVCVVGEPSPSLMQSMAEAERIRLEEQKKILEPKFGEIAKRLEESIAANERPAPKEMLYSVDVPSIDNIKFHEIERHVIEEGTTPFRIQYDSIKTNFITIKIVMNSSQELSKTDRLYLPLLSLLLLECPIERDGEIIPYETVVSELFSDTISYQASIGLTSSGFYSVGPMSMLFGMSMQVEIELYKRSVEWFHNIMYKTILMPDRIKTMATRLVSDISQLKRSGSKLLYATTNGLAYQSNSNQWATNFLRQQKFLKQLLRDLKDDPESVQKHLTYLRDKLNHPKNLLVHISLNKDKIDVSKIHKPWLKLLPKIYSGRSERHLTFDQITPCHQLFQPNEDLKGIIVGVGTDESSYMQQFVRSINDPNDPDLAAVYVLLQYLTQLEGPLWRIVRGLGLSYHYSVSVSPTDGLMYFMLYRSAQIVSAYNKSVEIINRHLEGEEPYEDNLFEAAKSSLIFDFIKREKTPAGKSMQSLVAYLKNLPVDFNRELIRRVALVTKDDLRRVGPLYLRPLFEGVDRRTVVCCHSSKLAEVSKGFMKAQISLETIDIDKDSFVNAID